MESEAVTRSAVYPPEARPLRPCRFDVTRRQFRMV
jgi:hypothetical protein